MRESPASFSASWSLHSATSGDPAEFSSRGGTKRGWFSYASFAMMKSYLTLAALIVLAGCSSTPPPRIYVLSAPAEPLAGVRDEAGRPVVELPTVSLPDYLDSTDIFVRDGRSELQPSATGRWGERLSLGITHALVNALGRRLPGVLVTHTPTLGTTARRVLVDVDGFDVEANGRCVLTARWTVPSPDGQSAAIAEQGTFVTIAGTSGAGTTAAPSDAAVVAAMVAAVDELADRIALSLRRAPPRTR